MSEQQQDDGGTIAVPPPKNATEAGARLDALAADREWGKKLLNGDTVAAKEFNDLNAMIAKGDDQVEVAMSGVLPPAANGEMRELVGTAEMLKSLGIRPEVIRETLSGGEVTQAEHDAVRIWMNQQIANREFTKKLADGDPETRQKFMLANVVLASNIKAAAA